MAAGGCPAPGLSAHVFAMLPRLLERHRQRRVRFDHCPLQRAGRGGDMDEPIATRCAASATPRAVARAADRGPLARERRAALAVARDDTVTDGQQQRPRRACASSWPPTRPPVPDPARRYQRALTRHREAIARVDAIEAFLRQRPTGGGATETAVPPVARGLLRSAWENRHVKSHHPPGKADCLFCTRSETARSPPPSSTATSGAAFKDIGPKAPLHTGYPARALETLASRPRTSAARPPDADRAKLARDSGHATRLSRVIDSGWARPDRVHMHLHVLAGRSLGAAG